MFKSFPSFDRFRFRCSITVEPTEREREQRKKSLLFFLVCEWRSSKGAEINDAKQIDSLEQRFTCLSTDWITDESLFLIFFSAIPIFFSLFYFNVPFEARNKIELFFFTQFLWTQKFFQQFRWTNFIIITTIESKSNAYYFIPNYLLLFDKSV